MTVETLTHTKWTIFPLHMDAPMPNTKTILKILGPIPPKHTTYIFSLCLFRRPEFIVCLSSSSKMVWATVCAMRISCLWFVHTHTAPTHRSPFIYPSFLRIFLHRFVAGQNKYNTKAKSTFLPSRCLVVFMKCMPFSRDALSHVYCKIRYCHNIAFVNSQLRRYSAHTCTSHRLSMPQRIRNFDELCWKFILFCQNTMRSVAREIAGAHE